MRHSIATLAVVGLCMVAADQLTKFVAVERLTQGFEGRAFYGVSAGELQALPPVPVVDGYAQLRFVENPGAESAFLSGLGLAWRRAVLGLAGALSIGFLLFLFLRTAPEQRALRFSLSCLIGGALGNFVDRVARGFVIDFVELHWRDVPGLRWPTFNLADLGLCVGVALLLWEILRAQAPARPVELHPGLS